MEVLTNVIREGVTAFHTVSYVKQELLQKGFQEWKYGEPWQVEHGKNYVITPYPTVLVAVSVGKLASDFGVRLAVAHTDSPCLKIKCNPELSGKYYVRMNVEPYGGMLKQTWFDRPLGIAGKLVLKGKDVFHPEVRYIASGRGICIIPSLAPHLSKGEEKKEMDIQREMMPIAGLYDMGNSASGNCEGAEKGQDFLVNYLEQQWEISREELLDYDLYLYNVEEPEEVGLQGEFISAPRIDNLASVAALLETMEGLTDGTHGNLAVAAMFDNEEIGSRSKQGADSVLLQQMLEKLGMELGFESSKWKDKLSKGFLLSMDGAQGFHPNYPDKSDPTNPVYLGKGPVIKTSASQRYLSDSEATGIIKELCHYAGISCQQQVNRSGMPGGQTLGPILSSYLPMMGADVGLPMLAMHSARELAAWEDYRELKKMAETFYRYQVQHL